VPTETVTIQQAYRFALDATPSQLRRFTSHAGGARYAYNWGLARIAEALDARAAENAATGAAVTKVPGHFDLCRQWTLFKDDPANGLHWVGENFVGTYQAALRDAAAAWKAFFDSRSGKRKGRVMGRPRFKKKGRARDSFQVHGGTLQVVDSRHVKLPKIGVVRTHEATRKLGRRLRNGAARIVRGTLSRGAHRWYLSLTVEIQRQVRTGPSARQRTGGIVGIDLGVKHLATLSTGEQVPNPRHLARDADRPAAAQRALARCEKGSARRRRAVDRVARIHARVANLRTDAIHQFTSRLVHTHQVVAVEDLNVAGMTRSARGSVERPGRNVRAKAGLNKAILDAGFATIRWQLESKTKWYGSKLAVIGRYEPSSKTCSACGVVKTKLTLAERTFTCHSCDLVLDRDLNAARNIAAWAGVQDTHHGDVASSAGETQNARGEPVSPAALRGAGRGSLKREARIEPATARIRRAVSAGNCRASPPRTAV
jgi:putative transposase